jgi:hypothetical protein
MVYLLIIKFVALKIVQLVSKITKTLLDVQHVKRFILILIYILK